MDYKYDLPDFSQDGFGMLIGDTLTSVEMRNDDLILECASGKIYEMGYIPDCCASCYLEDGFDDLKELVGQEIVVASIDSSHDAPPDVKQDYIPESQTWTFYTLRTNKGTAQLRWYGSSNGYYSETPTFRRVK